MALYTEGLCGDGVAILKDGVAMSISDILAELNSCSCGDMHEPKTWQQRVIDEKKELDGKIERLEAFMRTEAFYDLVHSEIQRMCRQLFAMQAYSSVLGERIENFNK